MSDHNTLALAPRRVGPFPEQHARTAGRLATVGIAAALLLTVFEGAIRKWILAGQLSSVSYAVYLSKDFLFIALLLLKPKYTLMAPAATFRKFLITGSTLVIGGAAFSSVQGVSPIGAALTLRAIIVLPLIAFVLIPRLSPMVGKTVAWIAAAAGVINCVLSVLQTRLPPDHFLNQYAISEMQIITLETGVRAAGTFAFITGLGVMSTVAVWAGLSIMSLATSLLDKMMAWIAIIAGIGCALTSVSRAPLIVDGLIIAGWALFARLGKQRVLAVVITATVVIVMAAAVGLTPTAERLSRAFLDRAESADDEFGERAFGQTEEAVIAVSLAPFGNGLGFEQVGGNYFSTGRLAFANFEGQFPRIVMDTTVLGLVGYLVICAGALYALQMAKRGASPSTRAFLVVTQIFLASIFYGAEVYNHTASSFGWIIFAAAMASANRSSRLDGMTSRA